MMLTKSKTTTNKHPLMPETEPNAIIPSSNMKLEMEQNQPSLRGPHELHQSHILCTKDKSLSSHPGNVFFRMHIDQVIDTYRAATTKLEKMNITKRVVEDIEDVHGKRFVRFDEDTASWVEADHLVAREKVGHAIRFAIRRQEKAVLKAKRKARDASSQSPAVSTASITSPPSSSCGESSDESSACLEELLQDMAFESSFANEDITASMLEDVEPSQVSESAAFTWTEEDADFLFRETSLFKKE